jgi:ATP-dependent DNA ligase
MEIPYPMLISDMSGSMLEGMLADPQWGMERKRDGRRMLVRIDNTGAIYARSRTLKPAAMAKEVKEALENVKGIKELKLTDSIILDGEMIWICANGEDHRTKVQAGEGARPVFAVWDLLVGEFGKDDHKEMPFYERKKLLIKLANLNEWRQGRVIECVNTYVKEESKKDLLKEGKKAGWEGYVFKHLGAVYTSGKGNTAYRYKYKATSDYIVIGYTESDKDKNPYRALVMAAYDKKGSLVRKGQCGGGFPDKSDDTEKPTRSDIWEKYLKDKAYWVTSKDDYKRHGQLPKKLPHAFNDKTYGKTYGSIHWLGKKDWFVIEVESQKFTEYGIPYMPQFQRIRDDKTPKDCIDYDANN